MTGENGWPVTPDWSPEPRPDPLDTGLSRVEASIPPNITLGAE